MDNTPVPTTATDTYRELQADKTEVFTKAIPLSVHEKSASLKKIVHPPSDEDFLGLPVGGDRSQIIMELKQLRFNNPRLFINGPNFVSASSNPIYNQKIRLTLLMLNGPRVSGVQFAYDSRLGYNYQDQGTIYYNDTYDFKNWSTDVNLYRPVYKSTTVALNATAFNNVGLVTASQFNPAILFAGTVGEFLSTKRSESINWLKQMFERMGKVASEDDFVDICSCGVDVNHHTFAIHRKNGRFYAKYVSDWLSLPRSIRLDLVEALMSTKRAKTLSLNLREDGAGDVIGMAVNTLIQVLNLNNIGPDPVGGVIDGVPTVSQISQVAKSYSGEARGGCFQVHRHVDLEPQWLPASRAGGSGDSLPRLYNCYIYYTQGATYIPLYEQQKESALVASDVILKDGLWTPSMTMGWITFDGLAPNVTANPTSEATEEFILVKSITGLEIQPAMKGAYSMMGKKAPAIDLDLMQEMLTTQSEFKDGMPASYNSWGMLAQLAGNVVKNVAPHLIKRFLAPKAAETINSFFKPGTLAEHKPRQRKQKPKVEIVEKIVEKPLPQRQQKQHHQQQQAQAGKKKRPGQKQRQRQKRRAEAQIAAKS